MQDHRRPEVARQIPHLLATPMPLAPSFHLGLGPRAEHVQIVAPKNEHTLLPAVEQMRLQVRFLDKRPLLPRYRVGLARPLHRAPLDVDDGHQLRMHPAWRSVHHLLAAAIVQVNAKRQVLRPAPHRVEHPRRQQLAHGLFCVIEKHLEVVRPRIPSAPSIPCTGKPRHDEPARRDRKHGLAGPTGILESAKQHAARLSDIRPARPRRRTSFDDNANNRDIMFCHDSFPTAHRVRPIRMSGLLSVSRGGHPLAGDLSRRIARVRRQASAHILPHERHSVSRRACSRRR